MAWGVYHAALIVWEWFGGEALLRRLPAPLRHVYLIVVVIAGWVLLRSQTLGGALLYFRALAGLNVFAPETRPVVGLDVWLVSRPG